MQRFSIVEIMIIFLQLSDFMKKEILDRADFNQVAAAHEVYSNLVGIYEDIMGGPRNCAGIAEYYAAKASRDACYRRIIEIQDTL